MAADPAAVPTSTPASAPPTAPSRVKRRATLSGLEKMPVSAVLIVLNGERHLDRVLGAVAFCDEILILDSGSTDATLEIAKRHGARVEHQPFLGYGPQKRRAVELAKHDWILAIDDDEVLDYEAATTLQVLDLSDASKAWRLRRRTYVGGREVRYGAWSPDLALRFFNRTRATYNTNEIHESVQGAREVLTLPGSLHHFSYTDLADVFARCASYSRAKATRYRFEGRRAMAAQLVFRALWGFLRSYVFKLGFRDGSTGVVVAVSVALDAVLGLALAGEQSEDAKL